MIISSGYNIAAPEVENALYAHPAVQECAVIGVALRGARPEGEGVRRPRRRATRPATALGRELQDHVKAAIAPYKYPREIEFVDGAAQDGDRQAAALRASASGRSAIK